MQWDYAIDAGSENMRLCSPETPDLFRESSLTAQHVGRESPFAWGDRALGIYGREPEGVRITRAVRGGLPADPALFAKWVSRLTDAGDKRTLRKSAVLIALTPGTLPNAVEALEKKIAETDAVEADFVYSDLACALGAGLRPLDARGTLIADIGAEHITASLIAGGRAVRTETLPFGASMVDDEIMRGAREALGCAVGPHTARAIKTDLGAASGVSDSLTSARPAFDFLTSLPRTVEFPASLVRVAVDGVIRRVEEMLLRLVRFAPVELAADLTETGITLAGGGAGLFGLDLRLQKALDLPVHTADEPGECVIRGLQTILRNPPLYESFTFREAEAQRA